MKKRVLRLAVLNIVANIGIPILSLSDIAMMWYAPSNAYMSAIALGGVFFSVLLYIFNVFRITTEGSLISSFTENDSYNVAVSFYRPIFYAFLLGLAFIVFRNSFIDFCFHAFDNNMELKEIAVNYTSIRIYEMPFAIMNLVIIGWLIGIGNSLIVVIMVLLENVVNIVLNHLFLFCFNMGVEGLALATVIARFVAFSFGLIFMFVTYKKYLIIPKFFSQFKISNCINKYKVNLNLAVRTLCLSFVYFSFVYFSSIESVSTLSMNSIFVQLFMLFSFFMDGIAYSAETIGARFIVAKRIIKLRRFVLNIFLYSALIALSFSVLFIICGDVLLSFFSNDSMMEIEVLAYGVFAILSPIAAFVAFFWEGVYVGVSEIKKIRNIMLISTFVVYLPLVYLLKYFDVNFYLWMSFLSFFAVRSILMAVFCPPAFREK